MNKGDARGASKCIVIKKQNFYEIMLKLGNQPAPIGARLAKRAPLPDYAILYTDKGEALRMAEKWDQYINEQNNGLKQYTPKKKKR